MYLERFAFQVAIINVGDAEIKWEAGTFVAGFGPGIFAAKAVAAVEPAKEARGRKAMS